MHFLPLASTLCPICSAQFQHFLQLCGWLLQQSKRSFSVGKTEDANVALTRLIAEVNLLGYAAYATSYDAPAASAASVTSALNPAGLRAGSGVDVVRVLSFLTDLALSAKGWHWAPPQFIAGRHAQDG